MSGREKHIYQIVRSAINEGIPVLKSILLYDEFLAQVNKKSSSLPFYLKESILEETRATEFPDKPSRLGGIFLCPTLDDIKRFQEKIRPDNHYIYTCEIEGGTSATCDLWLVSRANVLLPIADQFDVLKERAIDYWNGNQTQSPIMEIVTNGKVTIIGTS